MNKDCPKWNAEKPPFKPHMETEDWEEIFEAGVRHVAVCAVCRAYDEAGSKEWGKAGKVSMTLLSRAAAEALRLMKEGEVAFNATESTVLTAGVYMLRAMEAWQIIVFDDNMLAIREEWISKERSKP